MNKQLSDKFLRCISHEREQDVEVTSRILKGLPLPKLVDAGYAISNLTMENLRTGLGGKLYLELGPDRAISDEISRGDIKSGDIVLIRPKLSSTAGSKKNRNDGKEAQEFECNGVVFKITDSQMVISIDESQEDAASGLSTFTRLFVLKTTNTITYKTMESSMRKLAELDGLASNKIVQYLLNSRPFLQQPPASNVTFNNASLNASQQEAIRFALANDICIIHGPPGTGKTYTLVELIQQLREKGQRILVCGPSNMAVDTILERLAKVLPGNELLRIGHPARLLDTNLAHSLDLLSRNGSAGEIVQDIRNEINQKIISTKKTKSSKERKQGWNDIKELRKELKRREQKVVVDLILQAKVIVATLHGSNNRALCSLYSHIPRLFDTLIIDEVSQSLEPQCWIPLVSHYKSDISKLVLAGDNKQLPPTIKTEDDASVQKTLGTTLFDRLVSYYGNTFRKLLKVQYRMNESIMKFPSSAMYDGELIAATLVANKVLSDLPGVDANDDTTVPFIWYDTQGDEFMESTDQEEHIVSSKFNENEGLLVRAHIEKLIQSNVPQEAIGVIAPYSAQVTLLKHLIHNMFPQIEISTVDGFQGREKEVIILSLVRSNSKFEVGFLKEERRLNVAMTRPKKQLCVVGNVETLEKSGQKFLKDWAEFGEENADIRYPDIGDYL
ncbi:hypothetical protein HG536_0G00280 [Torulaspora globosa]|uniref:DNA helicase n=1 Tax=Torulaspora globosa TaxID=48254 RepID=A0A7G3ZKY5_9SACH|nr:uncharacterized protein HG536_0G00280 [Torulaspora globosa]QLL34171.1 hypothetical protein HG536_0G00280 [Torulaspora globosa]